MDGRAQTDFRVAPMPVPALLDDAARRFGSRPAIDFLGRRQTWSDIAHLAERAASGLQALGVGKGAKVGLCLPNTPYSVILYFAILKTGATVVNFNPLYTERELIAQIRDSGTTIMVGIDVPAIQAKLAAAVAEGSLQRVIVCSLAAALPPLKRWLFRLAKRQDRAAFPRGTAWLRFEALIAASSQLTPVSIEPAHDIAVLQYTGGTTGTPKAATLTHANLVANVRQFCAAAPAAEEGHERIVGILPFFHVFAMTVVMNYGVAIGAELILLPRPDIGQLAKIMQRRRPTMLPGVPTLFTALCNEMAGQDLSFVKFAMSGGAPLPQEAAERFERLTGRPMLEGYGLSEASPVVSASPPARPKPGSVGRALPATIIEIRDPQHLDTVLPPGARGEVCVRGPQVMAGYYNHPDETARVFVDGALRTGDIGYLDEEGYLFIVDRIKDLIICGGFNVYPRTIEDAAYQHPAVQDAIAIGVPDAYRGQSPKLFVTLRPGATATAEEILEFLKDHLNRIEIPRAVEIRETLPRTMVGKLSKKELVAEEAARAAVPPSGQNG